MTDEARRGPSIDLHGRVRHCEIRDVKFKRVHDELVAEVTMGFYLDDAELYGLGLERAGAAIEKGALRRGLGRYDLSIGTDVCTIRAEGAFLDKPKIEVSEVARSGQLPLPGCDYPTVLLFVVTVPLIGDCRDQSWGLITDSVPLVTFMDPQRADVIEEAAARFRAAMAAEGAELTGNVVRFGAKERPSASVAPSGPFAGPDAAPTPEEAVQ